MLAAACSSTHRAIDAGKAHYKKSANAGLDAGNAGPSPGTDAGHGQAQATAHDDGGATPSGHAGAGGAGASGAGAGGAGRDAGNGLDAGSSGDACVPRSVTTRATVLVLFDRSQSMNEMWTDKPKWQAAGFALIDALTPLQDMLTIGAVLFPSPTTGSGTCVDPTGITCTILGGDPTQFCGVNPISAPDQVTFKPGPAALAELQTGANGNPKYQPVGATPTSEAVTEADKALTMSMLPAGAIAVVLITDGEPNCMWDQATTVATLTRWHDQLGIKTYVVGLPGTSSTNATAVLAALARAGGTTDYLQPSDPGALTSQLEDLVKSQIQSAAGDCSVCKPACAGDTLCVTGTCQCPFTGDVACDGACTNPQWDDANCGGCGHACGGGETCCQGSCANTKTSTDHCGGCGMACGTRGDACSNGACTCAGGSPCSSPAICSPANGAGGSSGSGGTGGTGGNGHCH